MTPVTCFRGRSVALFGLGGSGLVTAQALAAGGAHVAAWDDKPTSRGKAAEAGIPVVDLTAADWSSFSALILSPGVPLTHPAPHWTVEKARAAGIEIIGDVELFCRERAAIAPDAPFIAITGTNGKSTTTALIAHLVRSAGMDVQMGGNIGTAVLLLDPPAAGRVHVVECSSFQVDLAPSLAPSVGVLLNITPDHLDRHGSMENYAAIKERLAARADLAVVGVDDDWCRAIAVRLQAAGRAVIPVSVERELDEGLYAEDHVVVRKAHGRRIVLADLAGIGSLRGAHNAQNAAAAIAALEAIGVDEQAIRRGLASFPGLAHRMEQVGRAGKTLFVNDSKATNADAAEKALAAFPGAIHWIIGGVAKEGGVQPLAPLFGRVAKAYLIGQASDAFAATLEGKVAYARCGTLDAAVAMAASDAAASDAAEPVVLLSPACASYDQYPNFEVRGAHFRDLVLALPDVIPLGKA
ncbi:UDP-N-acetylmuramoylalanine--D-glutamate ligase [Alsobacter metallidurans]|uniref:UDP-N-acetylmuramoylalanine--D-glutamate ligase n=1 Tax=Alsobacter metallidurans TaxID=340221 RepID=A0A917I9C1_9HYPH|nr:UDP-N-acetylmuramoyl-L-alanine--D-glutamate ligase [Alsobacter metallidurans]GGH27474.1 UDP-N-acetylmuramoylalanine--D-glutamate ligase [Alsobacter metallidurans]